MEQTEARSSGTPELGREKERYQVTTASIIAPQGSQQTGEEHHSQHGNFLRLRPLAGLTALCAAIACVYVSFSILVISDGKAVEDWPISPTVYLAISTAIANGAISFARFEAGPISWWFSAGKGSTIASLHHQWQTSQGVFPALRPTRHVSILNIACIAAALSVIDGPLLQRASTVKRGVTASNVTLDVNLPPELPTGFSGLIETNPFFYQSAEGVRLAHDYIHGKPVSLDVQGCSFGSCRFSLLAPAVTKTQCAHTVHPILPGMIYSKNATWGRGHSLHYGRPSLPAFHISIVPTVYDIPFLGGNTREAIRLHAGRLQFSPNNDSKYIEASCWLLPAIAKYEVSITNGNEVYLSHQLGDAEVISLANNTFSANSRALSTMFDIVIAATIIIQGNAVVVSPDGPEDPSWRIWPNSLNALAYLHLNYTGPHDFSFSDPLPDIVSKFNQLMFRAASIAASWSNLTDLLDPGISPHQRVDAQAVRNIFHSDLRYFYGAAFVELLAVILILPMYWGFWKLGHDITMSPFNFALAFDSPLLRDVHSTAGAAGVVRELGHLRVKFGTLRPSRGEAYTHAQYKNETAREGRLGFGEHRMVEATPGDRVPE